MGLFGGQGAENIMIKKNRYAVLDFKELTWVSSDDRSVVVR
jgi:hypothetical protein